MKEKKLHCHLQQEGIASLPVFNMLPKYCTE